MPFSDTIIPIEVETPQDVASRIAARVKARRLELNLTQEGLCRRAGIKLATYRKFERSGLISLKGLLHIAFALNALDDFNILFATRKYESIDDVINHNSPKRLRGKRNA